MKFSGIVVGWILGVVPTILTISITKDSEAVEKCRQSLYDLKNSLENLRDILADNHRSENTELLCIFKVREVLEKLSVQNAGLLFSYHPLNETLDKSLEMIHEINEIRNQTDSYAVEIALRLLIEWEGPEELEKVSPRFSTIKAMQKFLGKPLPVRGLIWLRAKTRKQNGNHISVFE